MSTQSPFASLLRARAIRVGVAGLALTFGVLALPMAIHAAAETSQIQGPSVSAEFYTTSECITTDVFIDAQNLRDHAPGSGAPFLPTAGITILQEDACTGARLDADGHVPLTEGAFQIDQKLTSATLNTTIEAFDEALGQSFSVDISITWTATGDLTRSSQSFHIHSPYVITHANLKGTFREEVVATGTVSLSGTNLAPEPAVFAALGLTREGDVVVSKIKP